MEKVIWILLVGLSANAFVACNLEREVNIELPAYESQYVIECYLEPGKPFALLLSKSQPYFAAFPSDAQAFFNQILVDSAEVTVTHKGTVYTLSNGLFFHPDALKIYNYGSSELVPEDFDADFVLDIALPSGKTYTASTRIKPQVGIDEMVAEQMQGDTLYRLLTHFTDPDLEQENFFRYTLNEGTLDSVPVQSFVLSDRFAEERKLVIGTLYEFQSGDTLIATLCHIDQAYYDFFSTVLIATHANGDPFAQPGGILSNIEGEPPAIGIFTGLNCTRDTLLIH